MLIPNDLGETCHGGHELKLPQTTPKEGKEVSQGTLLPTEPWCQGTQGGYKYDL